MSVTRTVVSQWTNGSEVLGGALMVTSDNEAVDSITATANATTKKSFAYIAGAIQWIFIEMKGGQGGDAVVLTTYQELQAGQGTAQDTIPLSDGIPFHWIRGSGNCPVQTVNDIKSIRAVSTLSSDVAIEVRVGYNG